MPAGSISVEEFAARTPFTVIRPTASRATVHLVGCPHLAARRTRHRRLGRSSGYMGHSLETVQHLRDLDDPRVRECRTCTPFRVIDSTA